MRVKGDLTLKTSETQVNKSLGLLGDKGLHSGLSLRKAKIKERLFLVLHHPGLCGMEGIVHGHVVEAAGKDVGRQGHRRPPGGFPDQTPVGVQNSDLALPLEGGDPGLIGGRVGEEPPGHGYAADYDVDR